MTMAVFCLLFILTLTVGIGISPIRAQAIKLKLHGLYHQWGNDPRPEDTLTITKDLLICKSFDLFI